MIPQKAILLAAPASNSGKTTVTLGLLRHFSRQGISVRAAKSGPDYIDPMYHLAACGQPSVNLDLWSMGTKLVRHLAYSGVSADSDGDLLIIEGAMGAIDGAGSGGRGSAAELAEALDAPLLMIVNAEKSGHSVILPVLGMLAARPRTQLAGFIANRVASDRHAAQIRSAAERHGLVFFGSVRRRSELGLPSRHLGLVPAEENNRLEQFLNAAADAVASGLDIDAVAAAAQPLAHAGDTQDRAMIPPLGQRIAVAKDAAFCFAYAYLLADWRRSGAEIGVFSPLADEPPPPGCDSVFLPGGYPEMHAPQLAEADRFRRGMRRAAADGAVIYGECGGFMTLGEVLEDQDGTRHRMLGLLGHSTSFRNPRLHLGYRMLRAADTAPLSGNFAGHEFHYASLSGTSADRHLFAAMDADGNTLPGMGGIRGSVSGSFAHLICRHAADL